MNVVAIASLLAALAAPQDPARPTTTVAVVLHGDAAGGSVEFGRGFELDVVRRWPRGTPPQPWTSRVLAPLVVDELAVTTAVDGAETVETRRCRAFVFQRGAVTLLPDSDSARTLLVDSCLPEGDAGVLELPPPPVLEVRAGRRLLARLLAIALAAGGLTWLVRFAVRGLRHRRARISPRRRLQLAVEAMAAATPATHAEHRADAVAGTHVLREAARLTRGAAPGARQSGDDEVAVHALLDGVKFAGRPLAAAERAQVLDALRRAVAAVPEDAA